MGHKFTQKILGQKISTKNGKGWPFSDVVCSYDHTQTHIHTHTYTLTTLYPVSIHHVFTYIIPSISYTSYINLQEASVKGYHGTNIIQMKSYSSYIMMLNVL